MDNKYPFKFLDSYNQNDTDIFFGRDEEIVALYEMVFQNSMLLVYGASGTGKTSLIQCGLAGRFKSYDWLALTIRRGTNINDSLEKALIAAGGNDIDDEEAVTNDSLGKLTGLLRLIKGVYLNSFKPIYLIFDQFEELYILGTKGEQEKFIEAVKEIQKAEQSVKMIFSIREEYLGHLFEFEKQVPQLLRKKLRVEPMTLNKVTDVIKGINNYKFSNVKIKAEEIDTITQGIFEKLKGKKKTLTIQLPYLQVFLDKLYLETTKDESRKAEALIELSVLNRIGDIGDVLRNFLEEQVTGISQKLGQNNKNVTPETIWKILSPFSTLEGTKEPISKKELRERLRNIDPKLIDEAVESFVNCRILNFSEAANLYELAHDSLALRIAEKRSDEEISLLEVRKLIKNQVSLKQDARELFSKKQLTFIEPFLHKLNLSEEEEGLVNESKEAEHKAEQRKRSRRRSTVISIAAITILVIAGLSYFLIQQSKAKNRNIELLSNSYWSNSKNEKANKDYVYALANAAMAFSVSKDNDFKINILKEIESKWPVVSLKNVLSGKSQILSAAFIKEGKQVITISKDYSLRIWDAITGDSVGNLKGLPITEKDKPSVVQFTNDGNNVITNDGRGKVRLWNIATLKEVEMKAIDNYVFYVLQSDNGNKFFTISFSGDPESFCNLNVYQSNGNLIFSAPINNTKTISSFETVPKAFISSDGESIVVKYDDNRISIFNAFSNKPSNLDLKTQEYNNETKDVEDINYKSLIKNVCLSKNGDTILTANGDSTIRLWDARTGLQIGNSMKHDRPVDFVYFNPDCSMILSCDDENSTFIWDTKTTTKFGHAFKLEPGWTPPVFNPDGKNILTVINGTVSIWQLLQLKDQDNDEAYNDYTRRYFYSPDLETIVNTRTKGNSLMYKVLGARTRKPIGQEITSNYNYRAGYYLGPTEPVLFSPDGKRLLTRYDSDSIQLWNADFATRIGSNIPFNIFGELIFSPIEKEINGIKKKPGPKKLITMHDNDSLKLELWNIEIGKKIGHEIVYKQPSHENGQNNLNVSQFGDPSTELANTQNSYEFRKPVFSNDGNWFFTIFNSVDSLFYELFDAGTGIRKGPRHSRQMLGASDISFIHPPTLSPDGTLILVTINDSTAQLLDAESGRQKGDVIRYHSNWQPLYSPNGNWLLICTSDSTAQFIDIETRNKGNIIKHINLDLFPNWPLINSDGSRVLTIGNTGTIILWNAETQKQIKEEIKHESFFVPPLFSPNGKLFITSDYYGTARLYDAETGNQKGPALKHPKSEIKKLFFSNNAEKVLIIYSRGNDLARRELTGVIWGVGTGKQIGQELKDLYMAFEDMEFENEGTSSYSNFSDDGKWLLYKNNAGDQLLHIEAGDLDIPADLLELQVLMTSGYRYDFDIDEKNIITSKEFYGKENLMEDYYNKAKAHYKNCRFTKYNFWKRFNEEEAKKMRPDDFVEENKKDIADSQFDILPALNTSDTSIANNGSYLEPGQAIYSNNKKYLLAYQADGNLVIYLKEGMVPVWASNTSGYPAYRTVMQYDGNLVIYADEPGTVAGNNAIWSSDTWRDNAGATLKLEDDGILVIYNTKNEVVWQSSAGSETEMKKSLR